MEEKSGPVPGRVLRDTPMPFSDPASILRRRAELAGLGSPSNVPPPNMPVEKGGNPTPEQLQELRQKAAFFDQLVTTISNNVLSNGTLTTLLRNQQKKMFSMDAALSAAAIWIKVISEALDRSGISGLSKADLEKIAQEVVSSGGREPVSTLTPGASATGA